MKHFSIRDLQELPSRYRANLINSCSGYKSCNLIGTQDEKGQTNLAIFNSIVHIGSNPPMLGFILRPLTVPRHTYENFKASGFFTINQVKESMIKDAHHTAAKYADNVSEFIKSNLEEEYKDDFKAPYVKESSIKIGCEYVNEYLIKENDTLLIIGAIKHLYIEEKAIEKDGWVQLDKLDTMSCIGLDGYALPQLIDRFAYAKPDENTISIKDKN